MAASLRGSSSVRPLGPPYAANVDRRTVERRPGSRHCDGPASRKRSLGSRTGRRRPWTDPRRVRGRRHVGDRSQDAYPSDGGSPLVPPSEPPPSEPPPLEPPPLEPSPPGLESGGSGAQQHSRNSRQTSTSTIRSTSPQLLAFPTQTLILGSQLQEIKLVASGASMRLIDRL